MSDVNSKLLPCPFCGGEDVILHRHALPPSNRKPFRTSFKYFGYCRSCNSEGTHYVGHKNQENAIKAWNTHPLEDKLQADVKELVDALEYIAETTNVGMFGLVEGEPVQNNIYMWLKAREALQKHKAKENK